MSFITLVPPRYAVPYKKIGAFAVYAAICDYYGTSKPVPYKIFAPDYGMGQRHSLLICTTPDLKSLRGVGAYLRSKSRVLALVPSITFFKSSPRNASPRPLKIPSVLYLNELTAGDAGGLAGCDDDLAVFDFTREVSAAGGIELGENVVKEEHGTLARDGGADLPFGKLHGKRQ